MNRAASGVFADVVVVAEDIATVNDAEVVVVEACEWPMEIHAGGVYSLAEFLPGRLRADLPQGQPS